MGLHDVRRGRELAGQPLALDRHQRRQAHPGGRPDGQGEPTQPLPLPKNDPWGLKPYICCKRLRLIHPQCPLTPYPHPPLPCIRQADVLVSSDVVEIEADSVHGKWLLDREYNTGIIFFRATNASIGLVKLWRERLEIEGAIKGLYINDQAVFNRMTHGHADGRIDLARSSCRLAHLSCPPLPTLPRATLAAGKGQHSEQRRLPTRLSFVPPLANTPAHRTPPPPFAWCPGRAGAARDA